MGKSRNIAGILDKERGKGAAGLVFGAGILLIIGVIIAYTRSLFLKENCEPSDEKREYQDKSFGESLKESPGGERSKPQQCLGITASGRRCRRMVYDSSGYCSQHSDQA